MGRLSSKIEDLTEAEVVENFDKGSEAAEKFSSNRNCSKPVAFRFGHLLSESLGSTQQQSSSSSSLLNNLGQPPSDDDFHSCRSSDGD